MRCHHSNFFCKANFSRQTKTSSTTNHQQEAACHHQNKTNDSCSNICAAVLGNLVRLCHTATHACCQARPAQTQAHRTCKRISATATCLSSHCPFKTIVANLEQIVASKFKNSPTGRADCHNGPLGTLRFAKQKNTLNHQPLNVRAASVHKNVPIARQQKTPQKNVLRRNGYLVLGQTLPSVQTEDG